FFQAEDGIRDFHVTGVQTCALPIWTEDDAELVHIVTGRAGLHHLDRATGQAKSHGPHRARLRPVEEFIRTGRDEPFFHNAVDSHNSAYSVPQSRKAAKPPLSEAPGIIPSRAHPSSIRR